MELWNGSSYRFCNANTLSALRREVSRYQQLTSKRRTFGWNIDFHLIVTGQGRTSTFRLLLINQTIPKLVTLDHLIHIMVNPVSRTSKYQPNHKSSCLSGVLIWYRDAVIDVRGAYVTPELNNDKWNVGNMWEKFTLYLYAWKPRDVSTSKVY